MKPSPTEYNIVDRRLGNNMPETKDWISYLIWLRALRSIKESPTLTANRQIGAGSSVTIVYPSILLRMRRVPEEPTG